MMKVSDKGVLEIAEHEGLVLGPYLDSVGVWTDGIGHTAAAGGLNPELARKEDTRKWSEGQVRAVMLQKLHQFDVDLDTYERRVNHAITVPLEQHQFDALVSFDFNTGGIFKANLTKQINAGNMSGAGFMGWLKPKEILKRRTAEQQLFRTGNYEANGNKIPVYDTLGDGRIKMRKAVSSAELFALMGGAGTKHKPAVVETKAGGIGAIITAILRALGVSE